MARLSDYVEILENNMECVILKVKPDSRIGLITLGCFNGNEEMMRLTKGGTQTCTLFYQGGGTFSWCWGDNGCTLVSDSTKKCGEMIQQCLEDDFDICITGGKESILDTLYIKNIGDSRGKSQQYKLMWYSEENICIHKNGCYLRHIHGLETAMEYVYHQLEVKSELFSDTMAACNVLIITGIKK